MPISRLMEEHQKIVIGLEDSAAKRLVGVYQDTRDDLVAKLLALDERGRGATFTAQHYALMLQQSQQGLELLHERLGDSLGASFTAASTIGLSQAVAEIVDLERRFGTVDLAERVEKILPVIPADQVAALAEPRNLLLSRFGELASDGTARSLAVSLAEGESIRKAAKRLGGELDMERWRLVRIARTEINNAANMGHEATIRQVVAEFPEMGLKKQWSSHIDDRTSPVCRALDGVVVEATASP